MQFMMKNFVHFIKPDDRDYMSTEIEKIFLHAPDKEDLLITLSVRTAWDAFL